MSRGLFAGLAVIGAALLVAAELSPVYEVVIGALEIVRRRVEGAENHSWALLVIAVVALAMTLAAWRGSRAPAIALVALGGAALFVTLALDLPDARKSGRLPESVAYEEARARPARGLYLAGAGGALLIVAGAGLLSGSRGGPREHAARTHRARPVRDRSRDVEA